MNKGIFILSFDCEGKWGMADCITRHHETHFTNKNIRNAYQQITSTLKLYDISATFAFVSALTLSINEFNQHKDIFFKAPPSYSSWLSKFHQDTANAQYEGWLFPEALEIVMQEGRHEIGSHSCFHRPLDENDLGYEDAEYDFISSRLLLANKKVEPKTFIYPRNIVGYPSLLKKYGFIGYREGNPHKKGGYGRLYNLASEMNVFQKAQPPLPDAMDSLHRIPSGFFLNWPSGLRKYVPASVTYLRWKHMLKDAVRNKTVAHMWFHPHNFIDGPGMCESFAHILKDVAHYREQGILSVMTMEEYCRKVNKDFHVI